MSRLHLQLAAWAAWAPGLADRAAWQAWAAAPVAFSNEGEPALPWVPAMIRRRADRVARMALQVAHAVLGARTGLPVVFVSRHGSVARSAALLEALASGTPLSPAGFAASVHNAATGLYGIVRKDTAPCASIAAGRGGVPALLAEVAGFLADGYPEVLGILCDEPPPAHYTPYLDGPESAFAWAGVFCAEDGMADEDAVGLSLRPAPAGATVAPSQVAGLEWIRWLLSQTPAWHCDGLGGAWVVTRD